MISNLYHGQVILTSILTLFLTFNQISNISIHFIDPTKLWLILQYNNV